MSSLLEGIVERTIDMFGRWRTITLSEALAQLDSMGSITVSYAAGRYHDRMLFAPEYTSKQTLPNVSSRDAKEFITGLPIPAINLPASVINNPLWWPDWVKLTDYDAVLYPQTNVVVQRKVTAVGIHLRIYADDVGREIVHSTSPLKKDYQRFFANFEISGRLKKAKT